MTNTNMMQDLVERIERLVQEHISETHIAARAAVERAFASSLGTKPSSARRQQSSRPRKRRASQELAAMSERLYEAVRAKPGETMAVLAPTVGGTARELNRPMMRLKRAGRVRVVGTRSSARYFPMAKAAEAAE